MNNVAFEQGPSTREAAFGFDREASDVFLVFSRKAVSLSEIEYTVYLSGYRGLVRLAQPGSRFDQRLQHRFKVEG